MDPVIGLLRDLIAIDSVNPSLVPGASGERMIADFVAHELGASGLDVEVREAAPGRPNVVGVLEGRSSGSALMLCGHLDTVGVTGMADPFTPVERDGRVYGRGAQDMKGGVAAMLAAARQLAAGGLASGRLIIAAVADEEHASIGAEALVRGFTADAAVVTEPTALDVVVAHKGFAWLDIEVFGKAAHGSRPDEGQDAIVRMGRVLGALEDLDRALRSRPPHPIIGTGSLHASIISGGHELSSYPAHAQLQMERRTIPADADAPLGDVQAILDRLTLDDPSFRASARLAFERPPYELLSGHPLPQMLGDVLAKAGRSCRVGGTTFWTDAAILGQAGIPSIVFGPGGAGLHSTVEYVNVADVLACRDALIGLARAFC